MTPHVTQIEQANSQHWSTWPTDDKQPHSRIESLEIRTGLAVIISDIRSRQASKYHHIEIEDTIGVGFHLCGGARFFQEDAEHVTAPLEIWLGANAKGSSSTFELPATGFRTIVLRFGADAALELLGHCDGDDGPLASRASIHNDRSSIARMGFMSARSATVVDEMLNSPFTGGLRQLQLESGALALIVGLAQNNLPAKHCVRHSISRQLLGAKEHLDANLSDPPTTVQLARIVGINDFALKRGFKEQFGTTVFGYVRQRRMEQALAHLDAGMSVASAAILVGYECPRCFADAFRRHFGLLPSETGPRARLPARNR